MSMDPGEQLQRSIDQLTRTVEDLRKDLVRRDVYDADQRGVDARITNVETDIDKQEARADKADERRAADKRLLIASFAAPIVILVFQLYLRSQGAA